MSSRLISDPLHLLDCCIISDGGGAVVVTCVKGAEDGGAYVVRAYEASGRPATARIEMLGRTIEASFGANEIKTFVDTRETDLLEW